MSAYIGHVLYNDQKCTILYLRDIPQAEEMKDTVAINDFLADSRHALGKLVKPIFKNENLSVSILMAHNSLKMTLDNLDKVNEGEKTLNDH